jgi:hypothetical protein
MVDATIAVVSIAYINTNIGNEYVRRDLWKFFQYNSEIRNKQLRRFEFKIYLTTKFNKPSLRPEKSCRSYAEIN